MAKGVASGSGRLRLPGGAAMRATLLAASAVLTALLTALYLLRPDWAAAATIWPPWVWTVVGMPLAVLGWRRDRPWWGWFVLGLWAAFTLLLNEEPRTLARALLPPPSGSAFRVVSLNCAGGSAEAAGEVAAVRPDVVLLQETPGREEVEALGKRLFGSEAGVVWGLDASVLVRGGVREQRLDRRVSRFTAGRALLRGGQEAHVVSLRLTPPIVRFDLWSPSCWTEQAENRRVRREQLQEVMAALEDVPTDLPLILGGDFNAPAGDSVFRLLRPRLRDPFARAGRGWAHTALNDIPVSRIDQVWASSHFRPLSVTARKTVHSDHRMVVCDLSPEALR